MSELFYKNTCNWSKVYAVFGKKREELTYIDADGDYLLEYDSDKYTSIYFENEIGEKTGIVYPGKLPIGVEYKKNEGMGKKLTYLFAKNIEKKQLI